jgi:hypothetical protein
VYVLIVHADGREERLVLWYTVDQAAPLVDVTVEGDVRPGATVTLRARQTITRADLRQVGMTPRDPRLTPERAMILSDARRVEVSTPWGEIVSLETSAPGEWAGTLVIPTDAHGTLALRVYAVDLAANLRVSPLHLRVSP